jgi:hypothetical protein
MGVEFSGGAIVAQYAARIYVNALSIAHLNAKYVQWRFLFFTCCPPLRFEWLASVKSAKLGSETS